MSQATSIPLKIADDTTVLTFAPRSVQPSLSRLVADMGGMSAANPVLELGLSNASNRRKTDHATLKLSMPLLRAVGDPAFGVNQVSDTALFKGQLILPEIMTAEERSDFIALVQNAYQHAVIKQYGESLNPMW